MTTTPAVAPLSADEMDETLARVERAATMFRDINAFHPGHFRQLQNFANDALALIAQARAARPAPADDGLKDMEARKDAAYYERNQVVAALAKCFPSGVAKTAIEGWSEDWHGCVYIDLPTGQVSWHFHDSQVHLFAGLPPYGGKWDGHDTPEKYRRVAALTAATPQSQVATYTAGVKLLNSEELAALRRFDECAQDGEGYDVPKEMMQRLAEIGVVQRRSGAYYQATDFGQRVLDAAAAPVGDAEDARQMHLCSVAGAGLSPRPGERWIFKVADGCSYCAELARRAAMKKGAV